MVEEQLPSGILLFFVVVFFVSAVFVFFWGAEDVNAISAILWFAFVVLGEVFA